jgi:hypothetical protein
MAKPKPKGWSSLSKAQQEKWKKENFSSATKVTSADLDKLRAEKTPEKAIAKYKNDPKMREALNRFYGKARVGQVTGGSTTQPGGPGSKMPGRPAGGPGAKGGADGRVKGSVKSSTATRTYGSRTGGKITVNAAADDKRKADFQSRTGKAIAVGAAIIPAARGAMMAKGAFQAAQKAQAAAKAAKSLPKVTPKAAPKAAPKPKTAPKATPKVAPKAKATPMRNPTTAKPKAPAKPKGVKAPLPKR